MLKRFAWIIGVVLVANAGALAVAARNGNGTPDATLNLTERELRVTNLGTDTTGMTLTLHWDRNAVMPWFDRAKLVSLGFDCSMAPDAPGAWDHYAGPWILPRSAYVVFEYDADRSGNPAYEYDSWLKPVDASTDPRALRAKYTDRHRYLITAGTVRPTLVPSSKTQPAILRGQVLWIDPIQVYVPQEMQQTIVAALGKDLSASATARRLTRPPRYEVTVEYGSSWLPKVVAVKRY
jgi:hypothetical protein